MKLNRFTDIIFKIILPIISIIIFLSSLLLEYLSNRSMGVYRHLIFKNKGFGEKFLTNNHILSYKIIIIWIIILSIAILVKSILKLKNKNKNKINNLLGLILSELFLLYGLINYNLLDFNAILQIVFSVFLIFLTQLVKTIYIYKLK